MECYEIKNLSFSYPNRSASVINDISFTVKEGEFVLLCGKSGCGKTTLLRLLKPALAPYGNLNGEVRFLGKRVNEYGVKDQAKKIGFVMQSPDNQIVTDKVWHELAFGLESLGMKTPEIRGRVAEMASFFGIQTWFHKKVTELSGGQKQLLNLASVMVMQPSVLILDEPTSQLDPIAAQEFLDILLKINRELGTSIILTDHRTEETFAVADRVLVMDNGKIIADDTPRGVGLKLKKFNHDMYEALPIPMRLYDALDDGLDYPLTVREGKKWFDEYSEKHFINKDFVSKNRSFASDETVIEVKNAWFRYEKNSPDVVKNLSFSVKKGELFVIVGGNGTGKSTALSLISGINSPYRGEVIIEGERISKKKKFFNGTLGVLPQNPQCLFVKKTVYLDLMEVLNEKKIPLSEKEEKIKKIAEICHIEHLLSSHPYDLSGGEQQRAALAKVLLISPEILLLDEPTKGMDAHFKREFADILYNIKEKNVTVLMISHDIEFCAEYADRCALFFDGSITSVGEPAEFFAGKNFYTTVTNRMVKNILPNAVLCSDVLLACGKDVPAPKEPKKKSSVSVEKSDNKTELKRKKLSFGRKLLGLLFFLLFILENISVLTNIPVFSGFVAKFGGLFAQQIEMVLFAFASLYCFFPPKNNKSDFNRISMTKSKLMPRTIVAVLLILFAVPFTIFAGYYFFDDRKYYFISLLIILETMLPFAMVFESRKPKARELVIISALCAITVAGRAAFFMIPQFKPVVALVIISGICFGGETGFLVGAVSGFVSNFFFGQGPWTPWQMFSFGIIGFIAGLVFETGILRKTKLSLCIFGFLSTFLIYGGIMNFASVAMMQPQITKQMLVSTYCMGIPFDLIHAVSTAMFLWFISEPMIEKLERIKIKYGLISR